MLKTVKSVVKSAGSGVAHDPEVQKIVERHPRFFHFVRKRLTPDEKFGLILTVGTLVSLWFTYLFFGIWQDLVGNEPLIAADLRIINLVQIFRTPLFNNVMLLFTDLAHWPAVWLGITFVSVYLIFQKRLYYLIILLLSVGGGEIFVWLIKTTVARPRPPLVNALIVEPSFSFPSGHMFVALSFYGLLVYFLWHRYKRWWRRALILIIGSLLVAAIGFSRIYLGVHWPSDVLASFAAGMAWLAILITALEIRRKFNRRSRGRLLLTPWWRGFWAITMIGFWLLFISYFFISHPLVNHQILNLNKQITVNASDLPDGLFSYLPKTSESITGKPMEPINLIIIGRWPEIVDAFKSQEWHLTDPITVKTLWKMTVASIFNKPYQQAPGTPTFWDSQPNENAFEHATEKNSVRERHHVHFWNTPFMLDDRRQIWFATAHFDKTIDLTKNLIPAHTIDPAIDKERDKIKKDLLASGAVENIKEFQIVEPTLGENQAGDLFFTDGKADIIFLNNKPE